MTQPIHIIAEAGNNHNSQRTTAEKLVDVAIAAGANSIKFQIIYPEGLYLPQFFSSGQYIDNEVFQKRAAGMLTDEDYRLLNAYCRSKRIPFSASIFDQRGIALLDELDVDYIKIASCDLNNSRLLLQAAACGRKLIVSTGMASLGEIERAVEDIVHAGNTDIVLMHCVSVYPAPTERMNINFLKVLKESFGFPIGLSDHTENSLAAAMGVALGVEWIEKHFTLDRTSEGFDHAYAMEPEMLKQYIADIRSCEAAMQRQAIKVGTAEATVKQRARRGLYAAHAISAGATLTEDDILIVRPENTLSPNDNHLLIGRKARRAIRQYEPFSLDCIE